MKKLLPLLLFVLAVACKATAQEYTPVYIWDMYDIVSNVKQTTLHIYNANNELEVTEKRLYNSNGLLTEQAEVSASNTQINRFTYNDKQLVATWEKTTTYRGDDSSILGYFDEDGFQQIDIPDSSTYTTLVKYSYDEKGNVTSFEEYVDGKLMPTRAEGYPISDVTATSHSILRQRPEFPESSTWEESENGITVTYTRKNNVHSIVVKDEEENILDEVSYRYDDKGRLTDFVSTDKVNGITVKSRTAYSFDNKNRLVKHHQQTGDYWMETTTYTYDDKGNMLKIENTTSENNGMVAYLESKLFSSNYEQTFEYDERNSWIRSVMQNKEGDTKRCEREVVYYE